MIWILFDEQRFFENNEYLSHDNHTNMINRKYKYIENGLGFKNTFNIKDVDFSMRWTEILRKHTFQLGWTFLDEIYWNSFLRLLPLFIGYVVTTGNHYLFLWMIVVYCVSQLFGYMSMRNYCHTVAQIMQSVQYSAVKFFLLVDPEFHSTRSSGQILAKTNRGSESFENFLDLIVFDLINSILTPIITVISLIIFDRWIGLKAGVILIIILCISVINQRIISTIVNPVQITQDDENKATNVESLQQAMYIRACFATPEQIQKVKRQQTRQMEVLATSWGAETTGSFVVRFLYILSAAYIGWEVLGLQNMGVISSPIALSLIVTYIAGTDSVNRIGRIVGRLGEKLAKIKDLYSFIATFGKQTYPVLDESYTNNSLK